MQRIEIIIHLFILIFCYHFYMTEEALISLYGKEKAETWKKEFQNATIRGDFIFCKAMQNMDICKEVLRLFLQDVVEIKSISPQSTIDRFFKI